MAVGIGRRAPTQRDGIELAIGRRRRHQQYAGAQQFVHAGGHTGGAGGTDDHVIAADRIRKIDGRHTAGARVVHVHPVMQRTQHIGQGSADCARAGDQDRCA